MIALSLCLPELATDLARARSRIDPRSPITLARVEHQREIVAACCARARRSGVEVGMTVSQAKALLPACAHHDAYDGVRLGRALHALAVRALRFTPLVMPDQDGLWLDCTGCTHLFGGTRRMAALVAETFARMRLVCRVGVAPCMGAAWAVARFSAEPIVFVPEQRLAQMLAPLPIEALRLTGEQAHTLRSVGIVSIADLVRVPRDDLAERCGAGVLHRLDQAFGRTGERVEPIRPRTPASIARSFSGPTDRPEAVALCVRQLLSELAARLAEREAGCREVVLTLGRSDLPPVAIIARTSSLSRDPKHWYTLLRSPLEQAHMGFGVDGVRIEARGVRVLAHQQPARWLDRRVQDGIGRVARLADTLKSRLGERRVLRVRTRASHLPEQAWAAETVETLDPHAAADIVPPTLDRPTLLLARPCPVEVVHLFPDGPIALLRLDGSVRRVVRSRGPERVCAEWWRREDSARDYYQVETDDGTWHWVFQARESGRWFLHGEWA